MTPGHDRLDHCIGMYTKSCNTPNQTQDSQVQWEVNLVINWTWLNFLQEYMNLYGICMVLYGLTYTLITLRVPAQLINFLAISVCFLPLYVDQFSCGKLFYDVQTTGFYLCMW